MTVIEAIQGHPLTIEDIRMYARANGFPNHPVAGACTKCFRIDWFQSVTLMKIGICFCCGARNSCERLEDEEMIAVIGRMIQ